MRCERPQPEHRLWHLCRKLGALTQDTSATSATLRGPAFSRLFHSGLGLRPAFFNPTPSVFPAFTQQLAKSIQSHSKQ